MKILAATSSALLFPSASTAVFFFAVCGLKVPVFVFDALFVDSGGALGVALDEIGLVLIGVGPNVYCASVIDQ